jgi:hypothetical protein
MLPDNPPLNDGNFSGGNDQVPAARSLPTPDPADPSAPAAIPKSCDATCRAHCSAANLDNPVNAGLCSALWGAGRSGTAIVPEEACRRLFVDTTGTFPTHDEIKDQCLGKPWGEVVTRLITSKDFVDLNRRLWADRLSYDTNSVSVERIYDMDAIVKKLYEGRLSYDQFAAVTSAHPVLTRKHATPGDRAEALFWTFLGRPPFGDERSDMGRLYSLWENHYYDHPRLGMRLPDAFIRYRCVDDRGNPNPLSSGECTSINFGFEQLILKPDSRADEAESGDGLVMWSGFLSASEWQKLQAPGRAISKEWSFWEHAVNIVIRQYLDYDLATMVPEVGEQLVRYVLDHDGDIRAAHFAVLTSLPYLQTSTGTTTEAPRFTYGPLKQIDAEGWVDSSRKLVGLDQLKCDLRINRPGEFLQTGSPSGIALILDSDWELNDEGDNVRSDYRDLVQTLGGCPDNSEGGRFKIVSVLTTANQLSFAGKVCDPALEQAAERADVAQLLPSGIDPQKAVDPDLAAQVVDFQTRRFFGRPAAAAELAAAKEHGAECQRAQCSAEQFARPACFALMSSAEMIFY